MGLNLRSLGKSIWETLTPQNEGAQRIAQANLDRANQKVQQAQGFKYGPLANQQNRQQFIQQNQAPRFSLPQATLQSAVSAPRQVLGGLGGMTGAPALIDTARLGLAEATRNQPAIDATTQRLANNVPQFLPISIAEGVKPFAQSVASTLATPYANKKAQEAEAYANRVLGKAYKPFVGGGNLASLEASQAKQKLQTSPLNAAGLEYTDPNIARLIVGQAVQAGTNIAMAGELPGIGGSLVRTAPTFGGLSAAQALASVAQQDNPTGKDYLTQGIEAGLTGAALPVVFKGTGLAIKGLRDSPSLDEAGSVPRPRVSLKLTPEEKSMGKALGMSEKQIVKAKLGGGLAPEDGMAKVPAKPKVEAKNLELQAMTDMNSLLNEGGTIEEALQHYAKVTGKSPSQGQVALQRVLDSKGLNKGVVNAKLNPNKGVTLGAITKGDHTQPILNASAVSHTVVEHGNRALEAIKKLSPNDHALLDDLRTTGVKDLVKRAENPEAFRNAAELTKEYNDLTHAVGNQLDQAIPYRQNYGAPLLFEQTPAEVDAAFQAMLKKNPGYAKSRTFKDYNEAAQYGLTRRNESFGADLLTDVQRRANDLRQLTLANGLEKAYPGLVKEGIIGSTKDGTYKQLQIAGGKKLSMPAELADQINRRAQGAESGKALKAYDRLNANLKYYKLGGGTFHGVTEGGNILGQQLSSGNLIKHPIQNLKGVAGIFSEKVHQSNMAGYAERGVIDNARLAGVTLQENQILGDIKPSRGVTKVPIIHQIHEAIFKRQIPEAKLMIFEQQTKGLDPTVPADLAKMRAVGRAVNNMGGINRAVDGLTPQTAKKVSRAILATDFTEGRWRTIDDAIRKGSRIGASAADRTQGKIARQMVVGKTLVFLLPTLAAATAAGKIDWNDPKDIAKTIGDQILDPHFPTGFKTPAGYAKIAKTPETFISEVGRLVKPIFDGSADKASGMKHYAGARLSAALSLGEQVATNQDYFGNPIVQRSPDGKINLTKTAANIGTNSAPIPVAQVIKTAEGKQAPGEAIINTLGLRTVADPQDPKYQKIKAYFDDRDRFVKGLNPKEQTIFNELNPPNKDQYGNTVEKKSTSLTTPANYAKLISDPDFTAKYQAYQKSQSSHDPLWDLSKNDLRSYMQAQVISKNNPGGDSKTTSALYDRLPKNFFTKREQYFADLKSQGVDLGKTDYKPRPKMPDNLVSFSEAYHNLPYGTGARSAALRSPEGQAYIAYLDQNRIYNNQERADLGLPPLEDPSSQYNSSGSSGGSRSSGGKKAGAGSVYKYAVNLNAGGSVSAPKISVKKPSPVKAKVGVASKPKVTIKKSLV